VEPIKIAIQNWPESNGLYDNLSTIIAILAFAASIYSAYLSRVALISSKRPFVWGMSYGVIDENQKTITPIPHRLALRVSNAPAQIKMQSVRVTLNTAVLLEHIETDFVRFPDDRSEWNFSIGESDFVAIINKIRGSADVAFRVIVINYKAVDGNSTYTYELHQKFDKNENQWRNYKEKSN
jgi:hypothetical protein